MVEGEQERSQGGECGMDEGSAAFPWCKLPRELQHKVLSYLPLRSLFQARCVCHDWRTVVHCHDFATMYDAMHRSDPPSPAVCYVECTHPRRIRWAIYEYARSAWQKMTALSCDANMPPTNSEDYSVFPVGGLFCFHYKKLAVGTWLVWNPLTGKWKKLPPYKYATTKGATTYTYAFEADETGRYKILMAHYHESRSQRRKHGDGSLVTEIYDSSTGRWSESAPEHGLQLRTIPFSSTRGGVRSNGVIYFRSSRNGLDFTVERVLLCYDIRSGEWYEQVSDRRCTRIFEWDDRVMTVMLAEDNSPVSKFGVFEWDTVLRRWADTGLEVPVKVRRKFDYSVSTSTALLEMVAGGDYLVVAGYARDSSFRSVVYNTVEMEWRCASPATAGSLRFSRSATCRLNGMVQFKPRLDWAP